MPAEIFDYVIPSTLYRYRSLRRIGQNDHDVLDRELRAIEEGYIWASPYMDMNDPMEGVFGALGHKDEEKRRVVEQLRWRKERTGICCFSETPNNELMWAHYADEFRGICIAYDFSTLRQNLQSNGAFTRLFYTERPPHLKVANVEFETAVRRILSSKSQKWAYEREWRLFTDEMRRIAYHPPKVVTHIYIGSRMPEPIQDEIRTRMRAAKVRITKMDLSGYRVRFDPIRRRTETDLEEFYMR